MHMHEYLSDSRFPYGECIDCTKRSAHVCIRCHYCYSCHPKIEPYVELIVLGNESCIVKSGNWSFIDSISPLTQFSKVVLTDCGCIMDKNRPSDSVIEKAVPLGGGLINAILIGSGKFFLSSFIQLLGYSIFKLYSGRTHIETGSL